MRNGRYHGFFVRALSYLLIIKYLSFSDYFSGLTLVYSLCRVMTAIVILRSTGRKTFLESGLPCPTKIQIPIFFVLFSLPTNCDATEKRLARQFDAYNQSE